MEDQKTLELGENLPAVVGEIEPAGTALVEQPATPLAIIANAVQSGGLDVDVLERLAALQERQDALNAERQ